MRACSHCRKLLAASDAVCSDDGSQPVDVGFQPLAPELSARFRGAEPFACGATGELWRVVQVQSGAAGLLKIFADSVAGSLAERTRCKRELRKQATIAQGNLPRALDDGEAGGRLWLLREFLPGESLAVRLSRQGALPVGEALAVTAQLANALDELHRQGLVHRDVKPGHALLTARSPGLPLVRLIDAGIAARLPGDSLLPSFGTAAYAAPEIALGKQASFRSDLYSLGCMLYEMLSGAPPFVGSSVEAVLSAQCDAEAAPLDVELPPSIAALLAAMLAKEPRRRPFSAQQIRRALELHLPAGMPNIEAAVRSVAPPLSASDDASFRSRVRTLAGPDNTQEFSIDELELAVAEAPGPSTQELELSELELQPLPSRTQELELSELEPLSPNVKTQELELKDILSIRAQAMIKADVPRAQPVVAPVAAASAHDGVDDAAATLALPPSDAPPPDVDQPAGVAKRAATASDAGSSASPSETDADAKRESAASALRKRLGALGKSREADRAPTLQSEPPAKSESPAKIAEQPSAVQAAADSTPPSESEPAKARRKSASSDLEVRRELAIDAADPVPGAPPPKAASYPPVQSAPPAGEIGPEDITPRDSERPAGLPPRNRPRLLLLAAAALVLLAIALSFAKRRPSQAPVIDKPLANTAPQAPSVAVNVAPAAPEPPQPTAAAENVSPEPPQPTAANEPSAPAQPAAPVDAGVQAATDQPSAQNADEPAAQTVSAVEAGRPFMHDASVAAMGGVISYKARKLPEVDFKAKARELYQAGKFREAAESYQRAATKAPSDSAAFAGLGASWLAASEPDKAIVAYQRAVQLKPEVSGFQAALGRAYLTKGDRGRSLAAYSKALALDPNNQAAKTALASLKH
jgi:serine/threonine protein kinase/tetratricopeptide (TPR) repeat protein